MKSNATSMPPIEGLTTVIYAGYYSVVGLRLLASCN